MEAIDRWGRPDTIHTIESIPTTSWFRPSITCVAGERMFEGDARVWRLNRAGRYRPITNHLRAEQK
jgi:hypothetical protein